MIRLLTIALALVLTACGQETAEPASEATVEPEAVVEKAADPAVEATDDVSTDEAVQVVEESAADEPESTDDQPILLARSDEPAARDWQFKEGTHYAKIVPAQPTWGGADKIEVAEFFWYGCPHCFDAEPYLSRWDAQKDSNVRFVRIPAMWNPLLDRHARMFFVEQVFVRNGAITEPERFRSMVFEEMHRRGNRLATEDSMYALFERVGISREDFDKTWKSFEVDQSMRKARDLARRYGINSVPTVVVNGKYRAGAQEAGSYAKLVQLIDELSEKESLR